MNESPFSSLKINSGLLNNLDSLGYVSMTPIQAQSLPDILAGKDVIGQGKTGSGKTAAFGLGLLEGLDTTRFCVQALVLCPTRELADQVAKEIRRLARAINNIKVLTLCGGSPFGPQVGSLEHGVHIVVGTPGRIEDHLRRRTLKLNDLTMLVLDEADRMLDMGFQESIDNIIEQMPERRQTLLFSATFPKKIQSIASRIMIDPVMVKVDSTHDDSSISQHFYYVENNQQRLQALRLLLMEHKPQSTLVFCNLKRDTQEIADALEDYGFSALALNGDLEQRDRDQTLVRFSNKSVSVLVATDVAARGLDIEALDLVINYQLSQDPEVHVHRIGRTGRAGSKGMACSFFGDKDSYKIALLEDDLGAIEAEDLPDKEILNADPFRPLFTTLLIDGGKKQKLRPGDILGALTGKQGITGKQVGKINVFDHRAYVAVDKDVVRDALDKLNDGKMKGRFFRVRLLRG